MTDDPKDIDQLCINTLRLLAVDMVEKARSGHPGMPLGAAPMAYVLWTRFLRHNPADPLWFNRDRFILSAGHGSALLYALLHLTGYDLPLAELKNFRQWGSRTPGHPEYGLTPGVEVTTGPLGQGFAMGVGMALAEKLMGETFNQPDFNLVDHYTYAIISDGDLMEGVSAEAASLAATLGLGKLIYLYDDNGISIEGATDLSFTEDVSRRFQAYGWQVIRVADGNDLESIATAMANAKSELEAPSLIMIRTHIGYGSPKQDSASSHGEPLGAEGVKATKEFYGWPQEPTFYVPEEAPLHMARVREDGQAAEKEWQNLWAEYGRKFSPEAAQFERNVRGELPAGWENGLPEFEPGGTIATRSASGKIINALAPVLTNMIGGSADLAPSNKTFIEGYPSCGQGQPCARNIHFGVREHAMAAIVNGLALHGGMIPFGGTFLVFSDYMRPALRLSALMAAPSIFVYTHDSIGVGEDGPTHQPVEHLAALRAIPDFTVIRPAEANETVQAWRLALLRRKPTALVLTRQNMPVLDKKKYPIDQGVAKGAYVLAEAEGAPEIILIASGSEVHLALEAQKSLTAEGIKTRVVSMPSWELFAAQSKEYQDQVLLPQVTARLAIEAGSSLGWHRWVGDKGGVISMDRFGASAPAAQVFEHFGFTLKHVLTRAKEIMALV